MNTNQTRTIALVALIIVGGGALAYSILGTKSSTNTSATTTTTSPTSIAQTTGAAATTSTTVSASTATYKDGTYSATGSYQSPGGDEKLDLSVTLLNDVITAATFTPEPVSPEGREYQERFATGFKAQVIGKDISSVHLTQVSGASLTPIGFNDALAQIEVQAKA